MRRSILFSLFANIVAAFASWVLLLFLTRFGAPEDVGLLALAQAIALPMHMFFTLKMRTLQATDFGKTFSDEDYMVARLVLSGVNMLALACISALFYSDNPNYLLSITAFGIIYSAAIFREYYISLFQISKRNDFWFFSNVIQCVFGILSFALAYFAGGGVVGGLFSMALSRLVLLPFDGLLCKSLTDVKFFQAVGDIPGRFRGVKTLILKSLPLGVVAIVGAMLTTIPRYFLEAFGDLRKLGIYAAVMSLVVVLNIFANSFSQAILPSLAKLYATNPLEFRRFLLRILLGTAVGLAAFMVFVEVAGSQILKGALGGDYVVYTREFFWAMVSGCALVLFHVGSLLLNAQKNYRVQVNIYVICAIISVFSSWLLVAKYSIFGAIAATTLCSLAGAILCAVFFFNKARRQNE